MSKEFIRRLLTTLSCQARVLALGPWAEVASYTKNSHCKVTDETYSSG